MIRTLYKVFPFIAAIGVFASVCMLFYLRFLDAATMRVQYLIFALGGGTFIVLFPSILTIMKYWNMKAKDDPALKEVDGISLGLLIEYTRCCPTVIKYLVTVSFLSAVVVACSSTGVNGFSITTGKLASVQELISATATDLAFYSVALIVLCAASKHDA
jgi:hypothetical protein